MRRVGARGRRQHGAFFQSCRQERRILAHESEAVARASLTRRRLVRARTRWLCKRRSHARDSNTVACTKATQLLERPSWRCLVRAKQSRAGERRSRLSAPPRGISQERRKQCSRVLARGLQSLEHLFWRCLARATKSLNCPLRRNLEGISPNIARLLIGKIIKRL